MALFDWRDTKDLLLDLLDRERAILLRGDFDALRRLAPEKERLLGTLQGKPISQPDIAHLKKKADHNQQLLEAARRGIRSISQKLTTALDPAGPLQTYDRQGGRQSHESSARTLERRA